MTGSLRSAFEEFHRLNPHVYQELKKLALDWLNSGHDMGSINMFFEVLRYRRGLHTTGDEFKLPNNHRAFYARVLMTECTELRWFFRTTSQEREFKPDLVALGLRKGRRRRRRR